MVGVCALVSRAAGRHLRRRAHRADATWARRRCAPTAAEEALRGSQLDDDSIAARGRAGRRGHGPAGRPERDARLQAPPGAGAHAEGARGGSERLSFDSRRSRSGGPGRGALSRGPGPLDRRLPRGHAGAAAAARGRGGGRQDRGGEGARRRDRLAADPAPVPRGHRPPPRPLRLGLPAPAAAPAAADGGRTEPLYSERFLLRRPLLEALQATEPVVLLIDEIDRADDEFEAFLLEFLSDFQVSIPELGHGRRRAAAARRDHLEPHARAARRAEAALPLPLDRLPRRRSARRRSCTRACPACPTRSPSACARAVARLRGEELYKLPGVGETIAWAQALLALDEGDLDETLGVVLKVREDIDRVREREVLRGA